MLSDLLALTTVVAGGLWALVSYSPFSAPVLLVIALVVVFFIIRTTYDRVGKLSNTFAIAGRNKELAERLHSDSARGMKNDVAFDTLERIYVPIVDAANGSLALLGTRRMHFLLDENSAGPFLAVVLPSQDGESVNGLVNTECGMRDSAVRDRAASFATERQQYVKMHRESFPRPRPDSRGDEGGNNVVLHTVQVDGGNGDLRLDVGVASYGEIVRTSDSLINEFALFAFLTSRGGGVRRRSRRPTAAGLRLSSRDAMRVMRWRSTVHGWSPSLAEILLAPTGRAAGLGVAVTMINGRETAPSAFVATRSMSVGTYPNVTHVLPAGMCNVRTASRSRGHRLPEGFIGWTMLAELLEECFEVEEMQDCNTDDWIRDIVTNAEDIGVVLEVPQFTGLTFDLLNLRPEVCATLTVTPRSPEEPWRRRVRGNWEFALDEKVESVPLSDVAVLFDRSEIVQAGVGSLYLANRAFGGGS